MGLCYYISNKLNSFVFQQLSFPQQAPLPLQIQEKVPLQVSSKIPLQEVPLSFSLPQVPQSLCESEVALQEPFETPVWAWLSQPFQGEVCEQEITQPLGLTNGERRQEISLSLSFSAWWSPPFQIALKTLSISLSVPVQISLALQICIAGLRLGSRFVALKGSTWYKSASYLNQFIHVCDIAWELKGWTVNIKWVPDL